MVGSQCGKQTQRCHFKAEVHLQCWTSNGLAATFIGFICILFEIQIFIDYEIITSIRVVSLIVTINYSLE